MLKKPPTIGLTVASLCALALGACGTAAAPTPTPTVKQAASTAYLAASSASNDATTAAIKLCSATAQPAVQYQACYAALKTDDQTFIKSLAAIKFPPEMKTDVDALTKALTDSAAAETALAAAPDPNLDYADAASLKTAEAARIAAAAKFPTDLSLPTTALVAKPPPTATQAAATAYLALVAPANAAADTFSAQGKALPKTATASDLSAIAAPYATALTTMDSAMLRLSFPPSMKDDVRAMVAADTVEVGDLNSVGAVTAFTASAWAQQFLADSNKASAAANVVRSDLGLPPPS